MKLLKFLAAALLPLTACASTPEEQDLLPFEVDSMEVEDDAESVGYLMAQLDRGIRAWSKLKQVTRTVEEDRQMRGWEGWVGSQARQHLEEVLEQLESGPPNNRAVAAVALGFTREEPALGPLLAAVEDRDPLVVGNALLGLGILARPETPLDRACHLLRRSPHAEVRRNAAFCLQRVIDAGGRAECARSSARDALGDPEAPVRVMATIILSLLDDAESLREIGDRIYDEQELVGVAAATSVAALGLKHEERSGEAARILVQALETLPRERRWRVRYELARLRGADLGEDPSAWRDWAERLP